MGIRSSVGNFINVANEKADQLTSGARALLCVPSMIAGLPDLGKGLIGATVSNLTSTLTNAVDTVSGIVTNTINGAVSSITGAIDGVLSKIQNAYDEIAGAIDEVKGFKDSLTNKVKDVGEFIAEKDNCDFAAATMLNCITAQAVGSVSDRAAIDIAKGLKPVSDFANDIAGEISGAGGAIDKFVKKQSDQIDKATKIVQKADIF